MRTSDAELGGMSKAQVGLAGRMSDWMRAGAARAAERVEAARAPLGTLGRAGQEFGHISARCLGRLVEHNVSMTERALDESATRLRQIASAADTLAAWREQRHTLPVFGERLAAELRSGFGIVTDGSRELASLVRSTWAALARPSRTARRTPRRRKAASRARQAARGRPRSAR